MTDWHTSETAPARDALYLGLDEKLRIALYSFSVSFGWFQIWERGEVRCIPPLYWCDIPRFDGVK